MARNVVLISGGPGLFPPDVKADPEHDLSWANYVTPPLLLDKKTLIGSHKRDVVWLVYKPAYLARWSNDVQRGASSVKDITDAGFKSYVDKLEKRASKRRWKLVWFDTATDLWTRLKSFRDPIARLWYWGHGRDDLWLTINRGSTGNAVQPATSAVVAAADIAANTLTADLLTDTTPTNHFIGCNTKAFATIWACKYSVHTEGIKGTINFKPINQTGGIPGLSGGAQILWFDGCSAGVQHDAFAALEAPDGGESEQLASADDPPDDSPDTVADADLTPLDGTSDTGDDGSGATQTWLADQGGSPPDDGTAAAAPYGGRAPRSSRRRPWSPVVLDAGHGGRQNAGRSTPSGVRGPQGSLEKDVTLDLARRVAAHLGHQAVLTREGDVNLSLGERAAVARRHGAPVFLSLHANAGPPGRRGAEAYVHARATGSSRTLATTLQRELARLGGCQCGLGDGDLAVLTPERLARETAACLLEVDYLSSRDGERRLRDPRALDDLARAIARGVDGYLGRYGRGAEALDQDGGPDPAEPSSPTGYHADPRCVLQVSSPASLPPGRNQQTSHGLTNNHRDAGRVLFDGDTVIFELENTVDQDVNCRITLTDDQANGQLCQSDVDVLGVGKAYLQFSRFPLRADQTTPMKSCNYEIVSTNLRDTSGVNLYLAIYV